MDFGALGALLWAGYGFQENEEDAVRVVPSGGNLYCGELAVLRRADGYFWRYIPKAHELQFLKAFGKTLENISPLASPDLPVSDATLFILCSTDLRPLRIDTGSWR